MTAVPWIRLYTSWPRHRKTILLRRSLGTAEPIVALWCWAAENAPDGDLSQFTARELERNSDWDGEPGKCITAMVESGFLDVIDNERYVLHEWEDGAGAGVKSLTKYRDRQREVMRRRRESAEVPAEVRIQVFERDGRACVYCGGEDKLEVEHIVPASEGGTHEEKNLETSCLACYRNRASRVRGSGSGSGSGSESKSKSKSKSVIDNTKKQLSTTPQEPALLTFPCDGLPDSWPLVQSLVSKWESLFPSLDVMSECRKAYAWVDATPERRKTFVGMKRFLVGWLGREQNRGGQPRGSAPQPSQQKRTGPSPGWRDAKAPWEETQ